MKQKMLKGENGTMHFYFSQSYKIDRFAHISLLSNHNIEK